jgi:hypothetical protein
VNVESKLANLTVNASFSIDAFVNNAALSASSTSVSLPITNGTYPPCGMLLPGDQNFTLALNVATGTHFSLPITSKVCNKIITVIGMLTSYTVTLVGAVSFLKTINTNASSTAVQVTLPALGMDASSTLTVVAKSSLGEQISVQVPTRGVATLGTTLESVLSYPQNSLTANQAFTMSMNNLTQGCNDNYTIELRDPTNSNSIATSGTPPIWTGSLNTSGTYRVQLFYDAGFPDIVYSITRTVCNF